MPYQPADVAATTATRGEFANLFLLSQTESHSVTERRPLAALFSAGDDAQVFREAAEYAEQNGFLNELVDELVAACLAGEALFRAWQAAKGVATLQGAPVPGRVLRDPFIDNQRMQKMMECTARIMHQGVALGSGVLITREHVLTSWHVVRKLFQTVAGIVGPHDLVTGNFTVEFKYWAQDATNGGITTNVPERRTVRAAQWCRGWSLCHEEEEEDKIPQNPADLDGHWDYAVLQLSEAFPEARGVARLSDGVAVPRAGVDFITILQYPGQGVLKVDSNCIKAPTTDAERAVIPRCRFLHIVTTAPGSSGSPCFDRRFQLFGIHQGIWENNVNGVINRGVPVARIVEHLPPNALAIKSFLTDLPDGLRTPVIGCEDIQTAVTAATVPGGRPIIVIRPNVEILTAAGGIGKTFRTAVAAALLPEANHLVLPVPMPDQGRLEDLAFASKVATLAGGSLPNVTPVDVVQGSVATWRRDHLLPALLNALDAARGGRLVWLILQGLNQCPVFGPGTSELLYLLYPAVKTRPWLRLILDGMQGNLAVELDRFTMPVVVSAISDEDIRSHLTSRVDKLRLSNAGIGRDVIRLNRDYFNRWNDPAQRPQAAVKLVEAVTQTITDMLAEAEAGHGA